MTNFEIAVTLMFIAYGIIFGIICAGSFSRTRRTNLAIKRINHILDCHNMRIDGIINRIDLIVQIVGDHMDETHESSKEKELCDSCGTKGCILQTGIIRDHCDFYSPKNDEADKKPGVGKWIKITCDEPYGSCYYYVCSACHNKVPKSQYGTDYFSQYCPTCGAKMEFESEVSWSHDTRTK